jgi:cytochrome c oxidase subunit 3
MYFTMRAVHMPDWPMHLPNDGGIDAGHAIVPKIAYATPFTIILVASSFTCQWGVFAAE